MSKKQIDEVKEWQNKFKTFDYNPKKIFIANISKKSALLALSFFLMIMASEILLNQPFRKKIRILHNKFFMKFQKQKFEKIDRIETKSFAFSFFLILQKLFYEEEKLGDTSEELLSYSILHWGCILKNNSEEIDKKLKIIFSMWYENKNLVLSRRNDATIDLIFELYKSFELGIANKSIIEKNIAVLIFSVSKVNKEFRFDVLKEFKKRFKY